MSKRKSVDILSKRSRVQPGFYNEIKLRRLSTSSNLTDKENFDSIELVKVKSRKRLSAPGFSLERKPLRSCRTNAGHISDIVAFSDSESPSLPLPRPVSPSSTISFRGTEHEEDELKVPPLIASLSYQEEKAVVQRIRRNHPNWATVIPMEDEELEQEGSLVWVQWGNTAIYPAVILTGYRVHLRPANPNKYWIFWLPDGKVSEVLRDSVFPLDTIEVIKPIEDLRISNSKNPLLRQGLSLLWSEIDARQNSEQKVIRKPVNSRKSYSHRSLLDIPKHYAAVVGPQPLKSTQLLQAIKEQAMRHKKSYYKLLTEELTIDSDNDDDNDDDDSEEDTDGNITEEKQKTKRSDTPEVRQLIEKIRLKQCQLEEMCLSCGLKDEEKLVLEHAFFKGRICMPCSESLSDGVFAMDSRGDFLFCTVCSLGGQMVVCDNKQCRRAFCRCCLQLLIDDTVWILITSLNVWNCYLCDKKQPSGLLKVRNDWKSFLLEYFKPSSMPKDLTSIPATFRRRPLRILSLFDGISTGFVSVKVAGLRISKYHAYEIDDAAIMVAKQQHGKLIQHHGDVRDITVESLQRLMPIDLVIGGSPCNELSLANPKRKGLQGGTGLLFYEYYRILSEVQKLCIQRKTHVFWLFENVASMRNQDRRQISRFFGRDPVLIDSSNFNAQRRPRLFWGNLPGMYTEALQFSKKWLPKQTLQECLESLSGRSAIVDTICTVTTRQHSGRGSSGVLPVCTPEGQLDSLQICELERIFGLPTGYTEAGRLCPTVRRQLLGKAWSVPVIAALLRPLRQFFFTEDDPVEFENADNDILT